MFGVVEVSETRRTLVAAGRPPPGKHRRNQNSHFSLVTLSDQSALFLISPLTTDHNASRDRTSDDTEGLCPGSSGRGEAFRWERAVTTS